MNIELGLTPDGRWEIGTPELLGAVRDAGFSAVGLSVGRADRAAHEACSSMGLRCHELLALLVADDEDATTANAAQLAEAAAIVRAEWVLTVFQAQPSARSVEVMRRCAALFSEAGAKMAVEFSPLGAVPTLAAGLDVVTAVGPERAGLMIDSWHFCMGASTWRDLATVPLEQIAYVQFADALAPESEHLGRETMHRRAMPGDGVLELDRFASTLLERGWEGLVSVEVLSRDLRELPVPEFARRAFASAARYWR